ncbi:sigma-54 dependent transcriptional regulator [bacterium]|nr:sigma-54 dependent transcriptional regulator [bacterium]MBU1072386.1 sigma-54 dependent transcriptional regulator [bacterium]MBU1675443.1 sigma-54 dependent transcriptional regulator [bacterium]
MNERGSNKRSTILVIDDDEMVRNMMGKYLDREGYRVLLADSGRAGLASIGRDSPDIVLLDLRMPRMSGLEVLERMRSEGKNAPVIVISGTQDLDDVVSSLRLGAWDYLVKPLMDLSFLSHAIEGVLERSRLRTQNEEHSRRLEEIVAERTEELQKANRTLDELRRQLQRENEYLREEIYPVKEKGVFVGRSAALDAVINEIDRVAETDVNVLVTGESGTGKELVVRSIHDKSRRKERPLISLNCASIPYDLFESELFGHVKGSFTGAVRDRVGRFALADKGTLFLDEVSEIPLALQTKLLRVLQEGEFEPVGDEKTRRVDVRILAASNRNLKGEVAAGRFRQDLYYRLAVYPIRIPPLRDRIEDVAPLAMHFLERACRKLGMKAPELTMRHLVLLESYPWHGNVRELQNVMERAAIISSSDELRLDLPSLHGADGGEFNGISAPGGGAAILTDADVRKLERDNIFAALERTGWKVSGPGGAAELLGLKPTTLSYRMSAMGIEKEGLG